MSGWIAVLAGWVYFVLVVAMVLLALLRRREAASALGWSLAIVFVPVVGILFFLLFGINRVPRRLRRKIEHHERFLARGGGATAPALADAAAPAQATPGRWGGLAALLEGLGEAPARAGNGTTLFTEGLLAFQAMRDAIEAARHHVHVEFYIFRADDLGRRFIDLLVQKATQGVEVRLIVDAFGSWGMWRQLRRLRKAGGETAAFLPLRPFGKRVTPNLRNHRKIVVCDGRIAFFGGLNVGVEYLGRYGRGRDWYDLHMELRGPAVCDLQHVFVEDWDFCADALLEGVGYFPEPARAGDAVVQVIRGGPDVEVNPIRQAYFRAIVKAERSVLLATPYLVPDKSLRDALTTAARSGVDVRIVTQGEPPESRLIQLCAEWFAEELLEAGVQILACAAGMMHAKAVVVDGVWGMIGTANLDHRSLYLNFEQMAVLDGGPPVRELEGALRRILAVSEPWTLEGLQAGSRPRRLLRAGARLLAPIL